MKNEATPPAAARSPIAIVCPVCWRRIAAAIVPESEKDANVIPEIAKSPRWYQVGLRKGMQCGAVESFAATAKTIRTTPDRAMASDPVPSATHLASRGSARPARRKRSEEIRIAYGQSLRIASLIAQLLYT